MKFLAISFLISCLVAMTLALPQIGSIGIPYGGFSGGLNGPSVRAYGVPQIQSSTLLHQGPTAYGVAAPLPTPLATPYAGPLPASFPATYGVSFGGHQFVAVPQAVGF